MQKIKILLIDDEYLALQLLESFVNESPELELVAKTKSPIEALELLKSESVDLMFLDIQMPVLNGVSLLKSLKNPPATIFTTANSQHALTAFDLNVVDYLLKPFAFQRFSQAVIKAKAHLSKKITENDDQESSSFLSIKANGETVKVYIKDILFIEGLKEYAKILCENELYITFERLKNLEATLPETQFLRVHKSYIINTHRVKSIKGNSLTIGKYVIPVSRSKKEMVAKRIF